MRAVPIIALASLAAIAAAPPAPVPGTVAIRVIDPDVDDVADDEPFADAVGQALGAADYTLFDDHSRYVAEVHVARERRGVVTARTTRSPSSAGIGSFGPAIAIPLGSKKTVIHDLVATTLTVRLVSRAGNAPLWTGSAMTANIDGAPVADKLARAAFASYPQTIAEPISVP